MLRVTPDQTLHLVALILGVLLIMFSIVIEAIFSERTGCMAYIGLFIGIAVAAWGIPGLLT